ncbi:30S ribosome-binding factor RbfA [Spiroplasma turonicum]|uniref:Ribosome-binding factor A n=1 Tax=Spiroplasma turonicum TaxID=216946 RepID=A0A0K1P5P2_9MOLU|nr:30S ribosome-binding factor RbfA [Spiroplasma turonicum]AKU79570.1 ribosome-binding factor A [Spiroplasma turonicum]ALX70593.1 ribosome-binding factor A [Spiroplasma turonicum]
MPKDVKLERAQSNILRELTLILQREFHDTDFIKFLTIHEVRLSSDMSHAKIFYSYVNPDFDLEEVKIELMHNLKEIRMLLANKVDMRSVPELTFEYDKSLDNANNIDKILKDIK